MLVDVLGWKQQTITLGELSQNEIIGNIWILLKTLGRLEIKGQIT